MTLTFASTVVAAAISFGQPHIPFADSYDSVAPDAQIIQIKGAENIDRLQALERFEKRSKSLPRNCLRTIQSGDQTTRAYSADCLNDRYQHASDLPNNCEWVVRTSSGSLDLFRADCLQRAGW